MKDMAYTTEELAMKQKEWSGNTPLEDIGKYPWGLSLYLTDEVLKKLGMTAPTVGQKVTITATAEVTGFSSRKQADGDTTSTADIQITAMEIEPTTVDTKTAAETLYKKG